MPDRHIIGEQQTIYGKDLERHCLADVYIAVIESSIALQWAAVRQIRSSYACRRRVRDVTEQTVLAAGSSRFAALGFLAQARQFNPEMHWKTCFDAGRPTCSSIIEVALNSRFSVYISFVAGSETPRTILFAVPFSDHQLARSHVTLRRRTPHLRSSRRRPFLGLTTPQHLCEEAVPEYGSISTYARALRRVAAMPVCRRLMATSTRSG